MAIYSQATKAMNMARATVQATEQLMSALEDLKALEDQRAASGLNLVSFDDDFAGQGDLQHIDGASLNAVLNTSIPAIDGFMTSNFHDDNLQKVRP